MKDGLQEEVEKLRAEVKRRPSAMMMCAAKVDDREKISFKGNKWENPIEFLHKCEQEMATIGSKLSDRDRIDFVSRHFQETASKWYTVVRDQTETYEPVSYTHLDVYKRQV